MKAILLSIMILCGIYSHAQITSINPAQAYRGDSLYTTISSAALFMTSSTPQGNIQDIFLKSATDSVFAVYDSTQVVNANTVNSFWKIPSTIATGLYTLVVRVYSNFFSGPTTDHVLSNSFNITTAVWPGDADNDQLVDYNDILPIGLGYGATGTSRPGASILWQAQSAVDWSQVFMSYPLAPNYKHADCNGDGMINAADTLAIRQNFSLTHSKTDQMEPWRSGLPALVPRFDKDVVYNGDVLNVDFLLGDSTISASHIYGIAFTYHFEQQSMDSASSTVSYGGSWLGGSSDLLAMSRALHSQGIIQIGITRVDHTARTGSGPIARASFKITTDNISGISYGPYANHGYITDVRLIDSTGTQMPVNAGADSTTFMYYPDGVSDIADIDIQVMPNPISSKCLITATDEILAVSLIDISGHQVWSAKGLSTRTVAVDISTYVDGLYFAQVKTRRGIRLVKVLIVK